MHVSQAEWTALLKSWLLHALSRPVLLSLSFLPFENGQESFPSETTKVMS